MTTPLLQLVSIVVVQAGSVVTSLRRFSKNGKTQNGTAADGRFERLPLRLLLSRRRRGGNGHNGLSQLVSRRTHTSASARGDAFNPSFAAGTRESTQTTVVATSRETVLPAGRRIRVCPVGSRQNDPRRDDSIKAGKKAIRNAVDGSRGPRGVRPVARTRLFSHETRPSTRANDTAWETDCRAPGLGGTRSFRGGARARGRRSLVSVREIGFAFGKSSREKFGGTKCDHPIVVALFVGGDAFSTRVKIAIRPVHTLSRALFSSDPPTQGATVRN